MLIVDNRYVEGSNSRVTREDEQGNTYQRRQLDNGAEFEVLKNFPHRAELPIGHRRRRGYEYFNSRVGLLLVRSLHGRDRRRSLVKQHPRRSKTISQHREAFGEECLFHRHEDLPAIREQRVDPLRLVDAVHE